MKKNKIFYEIGNHESSLQDKTKNSEKSILEKKANNVI